MNLVVAVTGASGAIYARRALELLAKQIADGRSLVVDWVASSTAAQVWESELGEPLPSSIGSLRRWDRLDSSCSVRVGIQSARRRDRDAVLDVHAGPRRAWRR